MLDNYLLELAAEGDAPEADVQPIDTDTPAKDDTTTPEQDTKAEPTPEDTPIEYEIDGEKVTPDQIKEWKMGNLRQQDYTRKTQEIARERQRNKDAVELYEYMTKHPEIAKKLVEYTPEQDKDVTTKVDPVSMKVDDIAVQLKSFEIQNELNSILSKDKDVNEMELIDIAQKNNTTVTNAYKIWRGENLDKIIEKKLAEQSKSITEKLKTNKNTTSSIISTGDSPNNDGNYGLTSQELEMAKKLDMTPEEYKKWK
jgi:hypothetical protein